MASNRPTAQQRADARNSQKREEMETAIAEGRLTVRQMTPKERKQADAARAAAAERNAARKRSRAR